MTKTEKALLLRRQNQLNRHRGAQFEDLIRAACDYYRGRGVADIEKTPEEMKPIFLGGVRVGANTISGFPSGTLCMGTTDGSVYFSMTKSGIDIKGNVTITGNLTTTGGVVNLN